MKQCCVLGPKCLRSKTEAEGKYLSHLPMAKITIILWQIRYQLNLSGHVYGWCLCAHTMHTQVHTGLNCASCWGLSEPCVKAISWRGLYRMMPKGWEIQSPSSCLTQSFWGRSTNFKNIILKTSCSGLVFWWVIFKYKKVCSWISINSCSSPCGLNFVLLSVMFLISFGEVFTKASKNILKAGWDCCCVQPGFLH